MIDTSARVAALCAFVANALLILVGPAFSQAPTEAQRSAIRSECRSDYMAHCSERAAGRHGLAAMPAKEHVEPVVGLPKRGRAVEAPEPKAKPKPERQALSNSEAKPEAKPEENGASKPEAVAAAASATPTEKPAPESPKGHGVRRRRKSPAARRWLGDTQRACRSDYMAHCASVPTGGAAALSCLRRTNQSCQRIASRPLTQPAAAPQPATRRPRPAAGRPTPRRLLLPPRRWCYGQCGRARCCSCRGRPAAVMFAPCAAMCRPGAAVSCSAWPHRPHRYRPVATAYWPRSHNDH